MKIRARLLLPCLALSVLGCSGEDDSETEPEGEKWSTLIEESWTLGAGGEAKDHCVKVTIEEDMYVSAIRPLSPKGTHHTFLAMSETAQGERCTTAVGLGQLLYASGVGSPGVELPKGVAMKLPAGKVLNLSLHLYNPGSSEITGTSGMEIVRVDPAEVEFESGTLLAGPVALAIPPGRSTATQNCVLKQEQTAFALFPHMHQLGAHFKTTVTVGGVSKVLHDGAYDFEEQDQLAIEPLKLMPGDIVTTECTFENPTAQIVKFGESSDTEMCFSVLFGYPRPARTMCVEP
ncbi:MAG TPA: hypothetical protein VK524_02025 [Polyangiaceae bacterium]|nr:hypothetical protein [Polyangiaceae bacterium]